MRSSSTYSNRSTMAVPVCTSQEQFSRGLYGAVPLAIRPALDVASVWPLHDPPATPTAGTGAADGEDVSVSGGDGTGVRSRPAIGT